MMKVALLVCLIAVAVAEPIVSEEFAAKINYAQSLWRASHDTPTARLTRAEFRKMLGVDMSIPSDLPVKKYAVEDVGAAPDPFDSRTFWPQCPTISAIRDQSDCGSCWAFGAVEAMSDRICVNGGKIVALSAEDMNSCSGTCGNCNGGQPSCAWRWYVSTGVVSEDCYPYSLPGCDHHIANSTNPCPSAGYPTPPCQRTCTGNKTLVYSTDKRLGSTSYSVSGEDQIMTEVAKYGPCEAAFTVYSDFPAYTSGIYHHVSGTSEGGHAVKFVGWGTENGVKFWIIANSWNIHWGEKGFFRIRRGTNECGIESTAYCGLPK